MRKTRALLLAIIVLLTVGSMSAVAQVRLDVDVPWLIAAGATLGALTGDPSLNSVDLSQYHIPLPYLELAYQFGDGMFVGGVGLRTYTLIVEFMGWPMAYAEFNFNPLVLRAELGGFGFFLFGVINNFYINEYTLRVMIPDISASFAFTDWFRAGAGVMMLAPFGDLNNFGWLFYVNGRFSFLFKDQAS